MAHHSNKVLITGINGFTGFYLSNYFKQKGFDVYGLTNSFENLTTNVFACDLCDVNQLGNILLKVKPNYIIHLAAISFVGHKKIDDFYNVNVIGTQNLLEAVQLNCKNEIIKIILASSATVYGNQSSTFLSEDLCPNPVNHYGISKLAMEQVAKMYFNALPILIVRPFNYTAPKQNINFVIPKIAKAFVEKANELELGNIEVFREYNSITFICECYYQLAISNYIHETVNLCTGKVYSLKEVINKFKALTNHEIKIKINQAFVRQNEILKLSGNPYKLNSMIEFEEDYSLDSLVSEFIKK